MSHDLFDSIPLQDLPGTPWPELHRPRTLDELLAPPVLLNRLKRISTAPHLRSLIFSGPPGVGKTTAARLLGAQKKSGFFQRSATELGVKEIRELGEQGQMSRRLHSQQTILFIDEIHRLNKGQQDVLLPLIESGDLVLIGATTENPTIALQRAILSRCEWIRFPRFSLKDLKLLLDRVGERQGVPSIGDLLKADALDFFWRWSDGDARRAILAYQRLSEIQPSIEVTLRQELLDLLGDVSLAYDRSQDQHYEVISAFIKSIRGSDPDAALYYLARMVEGGEDPLFIARRLVISASEDIGLANPSALPLAVAGLQAVHHVGWPEAAINLAQVVVALATSPKSNSTYQAWGKAKDFVKRSGSLPVPDHLKSHSPLYRYPFDDERAVEQSYWPLELKEIHPEFFSMKTWSSERKKD